MKNSSWKPEEEILLVNLYFELKAKGIDLSEADEQLKTLSASLSRYAKSYGFDVSTSFRNVAGIIMKMQNIEYIVTNGEKGLSSYSKLDKKVVDLFLNNKIKFKKYYAKATKMIYGFNGNEANDVNLRTENELSHQKPDSVVKTEKQAIPDDCQLVKELKKLKKSSMEAVDNANEFSEFKKYMHIHRKAETDLIETIKLANSKNGKSLILLCGNVGDGKSHLISYLKHCQADLLKDYIIHNDATESYHPNRDEKQQLALVMAQFSDENLENDTPAKVIVAINLGVLSNFIDSEEGKRFTKLAKYVEQKKILLETDIADTLTDNGVFYCVNFGDYHIYQLSEGKAESPYIKRITDKIFVASDDNVFYNAYCKCENCEINRICPVKHNFEFIQNAGAVQGVINVLLETVIKDKIILSTRDLLNFFYDIIVHPRFEKKSFEKEFKKNGNDLMADYLLPSIMFEHDEISPLISHIKNYDFAVQRTESFDSIVTRFFNTDNIEELYREYIIDTTLLSLFLNVTKELREQENSKSGDSRASMFKMFSHLCKISSKKDCLVTVNPEFEEFIKFLYSSVKNDSNNLKNLYRTVRECVYYWNGSNDTQTLNLHSHNAEYIISTPMECKIATGKEQVEKTETVFERFPSNINITLSSKKDPSKKASLSVDYDLYKMLTKIKSGYRPSVKDENMYAGFVTFEKKVSSFGESDERISISFYENDRRKEYMLELNEFDEFVFGEVK